MNPSNREPIPSEDEYDTSEFLGLFHVRQGDKVGFSNIAGAELRRNPDFLRLKDLAMLLLNPQPGSRVLEIGVGGGANLVPLGLQGASVTGIDLDSDGIERAARHLKHFAIDGEVHLGSATGLPFADGQFDAVLSSDFHEHLTATEKHQVLLEARRVLRPGGRLVLKTPNHRYLMLSLWYKRLRALAAGKSPRGFVIPYSSNTEDPEHIGLTTRPKLAADLFNVGFVNYEWHWPALRRWGQRELLEVLSSEVPFVRDWLSEDLIIVAWKPINESHFPEGRRSDRREPYGVLSGVLRK